MNDAVNGGKEKLKEPPITLPGAKLEILSIAKKSPQGVLIVPLEGYPNAVHAKALTDLVMNDHVRLIDVCLSMQMTITASGARPQAVPSRVFRITPEGHKAHSLLLVGGAP